MSKKISVIDYSWIAGLHSVNSLFVNCTLVILRMVYADDSSATRGAETGKSWGYWHMFAEERAPTEISNSRIGRNTGEKIPSQHRS